MRDFTINFDEESAESFAVVLKKSSCDFEKILEVFENTEFKRWTLKEIKESLIELKDENFIHEILSFSISMKRNIEFYDFKLQEIQNAVQNGIKKLSDDKYGLMDAWNDKKELVSKIINSDAIRNTVKIGELMRQNTSHIHKMSLTTNVIPVFDQNRGEIEAHILKNIFTLSIADSNEDEKIMEIPVGLEDLRRMVKIAENAIKKTELLEKSYKSYNKPVVIYKAHP